MNRLKGPMFVFLVMGFVVIPPLVSAQEAEPSEREAMYYRYMEFASYVKGGSIDPHWMADGNSFWYAEGAPANTVIYKVDPTANTKTPLFDTARLRKVLTNLLGYEPPYNGVPFETFAFADGETAVKFTIVGANISRPGLGLDGFLRSRLQEEEFILRLDTYAITRSQSQSEEEKLRLTARRFTQPSRGPFRVAEELSPDGRWFVGLRDHNLYLRSTDDGRSVPLTDDGAEDFDWVLEHGGPGVKWSPDSLRLAAKRVDTRKTPKIPIVHYLKPVEEVEWLLYPKAGQHYPQVELFIVDILSRRRVKVDTGDAVDRRLSIIGWRPGSSEVVFARFDRYRQKLDLMAADPTTGATRILLEEMTETTLAFGGGRPPRWLGDGNRFIWKSERSGWNHLYLYDAKGNLIRPLTEGDFPVLGVVAVDENKGWVYFTARGDRDQPYDIHLYRVNLEGEGFQRLTEARGQHEVRFSPSTQFFLDTHSTATRPPVVELRRADGTFLQTLSKANINALKALRWSPPEEFVVKAADGETDLYGVLFKPHDFDPNKKYPVIDYIYGTGLQVPHSFRFRYSFTATEAQAMAQLGFITFVVDNRGTNGRGKAFRDVVYGQLGRHEIPDHVATLKHLATMRPYMDLSRVGVSGASYGGYMAIRAMLQASDVFHVGVAVSAITDFFEHNINHARVGPPQDKKQAYEYASNIRLAANLKGKLLLIHGTSDIWVPISHTMKMIDALARADKPYNLIILPEHLHGMVRGQPHWEYGQKAIIRYFQEHLKP